MPSDSADQVLAPPTASFQSVPGIAQLRADVRASRICNIVSAAGLAVCALISIYSAWFYLKISSLGHQYGWGAIPRDAFPIAPERIEGSFEVLSMISIAAFVIGGVAFLLSVSKIRHGLEALLGKGAFSYGWGWTIGAIFIPIVGLYRPWVGFAELRKAVKGLDHRKRISLEWKSDAAGGDTIVLALSFIVGSIALQLLGDQATEVAARPNFGLQAVDAFVQLTQFEAAVRVLMLVVLVWYLWSMTAAARRVASTAETADTFD